MSSRSKKKRAANRAETSSISAQKKAVLLEDLGRSPDEHPVFSFPSPLLPWGGVVAAILITLVAPPLIKEGPAGSLVAAALTLSILVLLLLPRKLLLGQDGLLFIWLLGSRFISFRDIENVEMSDGAFFHHPGINLIFKNGQAMDFATSVFKERWAERDALISLLRVCVETARSKRPPPVEQSLLRAGKSNESWARALRTIGHGAHFDPRMPAVRHDDLWIVAESPDASLIERTAAFVALSTTKDAEIEKRLRIAIDHTAAPLVRSAMRAALEAGDDEAEIARVLERVEKISKLEG